MLPLLLVAVCSLSVYLSRTTRLSGDEYFYYDSAAALSGFVAAAVRMQPVDPAALVDQLVGRGWFLPGMTIILAPLQLLFGGEAPLHAVRGYMAVVNMALVYLIVRELTRLGVARRYAYLFIALPCSIPYYLFYLGMLWGDLVGVHLVLLALLHLERRIRNSEAGLVLSTRDALVVGLLMGATALVRPQYFILPSIAVVRLVLQGLRRMEDAGSYSGSWRSALKPALLIVLTGALVLAPWNYALNKKFGRTFMITSTSVGPLASDDDYVRSVTQRADLRGRFGQVFNNVVREAESAGRTFSEQLEIERAKLPKKSLEERLDASQEWMRRLYFSEDTYLMRFLRMQAGEARFTISLGQRLAGLNTISWYLLLSLGFLVFCLPVFPHRDGYLLPLSLKGVVFLLTIQPLFRVAHGRYYIALIPVFLLMVLLALRVRPRAMLSEWRRRSVHDCLVMAGQAFALLYGAVSIWLLVR